MWTARDRALALRAAHGVGGVPSDAQLDRILAAEGLTVEVDWPFGGRVREVYSAGLLGIRAGLPRGWVRWLKGHGLGHHLLHRGNHLYARDGLHLWQRQELEAELFAGALLLPEPPLAPATFPELADHAEVPVECIHAWQAATALAVEVAGPG